MQGFSKIAVPLTSILKMSSQLAGTLPVTGVDNSEVIDNSGGKNKKLA